MIFSVKVEILPKYNSCFMFSIQYYLLSRNFTSSWYNKQKFHSPKDRKGLEAIAYSCGIIFPNTSSATWTDETCCNNSYLQHTWFPKCARFPLLHCGPFSMKRQSKLFTSQPFKLVLGKKGAGYLPP